MKERKSAYCSYLYAWVYIMRVKRKINKILNKKLEEQFNMETRAEHIFSEEYEQNKKKLLNTKDNVIKTNHRSGWFQKLSRMTLATAAIVLLCSVGTYGAAKLIEKYAVYIKNSGRYKVDLVVEPDRDNVKVKESEERYARLNLSYIPQELSEVSGSSGMKFYFKDNLHMDGIWFELYDVNEIQDKTVLENFNVVSDNTLTINCNQAIYIKEDDKIEGVIGTDKYNKRMFIYFKEQNYLVKYQACSLISDEEMLKIGEGISIEKADKMNATFCSKWQYGENNLQTDDTVVDELPEEEIHIYDVGEEFNDKVLIGKEGTERDLTYKVDEVTISDNFDQIGSGVFMEECYAFLDDNGNLVPNQLVYIDNGDGINTLTNIVAQETVQQKVLYLTVTVRNDGNVDYENILPTIQLAKMKKEGDSYKLVEYTSDIKCDRTTSSARIIQDDMIYYDYMDKNGERGIDILKAGEEKNIHIVFCINECDIPYLYVNTSLRGGKNFFYSNKYDTFKSVFNYVKVQD